MLQFSSFNFFCSTVWYFCSMSDIRKMEKIQEHSLRIVYNDVNSSYSELLAKSGLSYLYTNRLRRLMIQVYDSFSNTSVPKYIKELFKAKHTTYDTRCKLQLQLPTFNTIAYGRNCVRYESAKTWNLLSSAIKQCSDRESFFKGHRGLEWTIL